MPNSCPKCGRESNAELRFCGMCGTALIAPQRVVVPASGAMQVRPVSGPSFLGLADPPADSVVYLLEDEMSVSHWGRSLTLVVFLGCATAAGWHWRGDLHAWANRFSQRTPTLQGQTSYTAAPIATSGSEVAGTMPNAQNFSETQATGTDANSAQSGENT